MSDCSGLRAASGIFPKNAILGTDQNETSKVMTSGISVWHPPGFTFTGFQGPVTSWWGYVEGEGRRGISLLFCCWGCMAGSEPASSDEYSLNEWLLKCQVLCSARCLTSRVSFNLPQTRKPRPPLNRWRDGCLEELSYRGQAQAPFMQSSWNLNLDLYSLSTSALLRMLYFFFFAALGIYCSEQGFFFFFSSCDAQA